MKNITFPVMEQALEAFLLRKEHSAACQSQTRQVGFGMKDLRADRFGVYAGVTFCLFLLNEHGQSQREAAQGAVPNKDFAPQMQAKNIFEAVWGAKDVPGNRP